MLLVQPTTREHLPKIIKELRKIDKHKEPYVYQLGVEMFLDRYKYQIKNHLNKTLLRLIIERKFRRYKVQEIPNLIDLLEL